MFSRESIKTQLDELKIKFENGSGPAADITNLLDLALNSHNFSQKEVDLEKLELDRSKSRINWTELIDGQSAALKKLETQMAVLPGTAELRRLCEQNYGNLVLQMRHLRGMETRAKLVTARDGLTRNSSLPDNIKKDTRAALTKRIAELDAKLNEKYDWDAYFAQTMPIHYATSCMFKLESEFNCTMCDINRL